MPLLIQLNSICEQKRSSISRHVRECLKELIKDYKDEIGQIVHADLQLAQELMYDLNAGQPEVPAAIADEVPVEATTELGAPKSPVRAAESAEPAAAKTPAPAVELATESPEAEPEPQPRKTRRKAEPPKEESPKPVRSSRRGKAQAELEVKEEEEPVVPRPARKRRGAN